MAKHRLQEWKYQLEHNPSVVKAQHWYQGLSEKEQKLVYGLSVLLVLAIFYTLILAPSGKSLSSAEQALKRELTLHQWMQDNRHRVKGAQASSGSTGGSVLSQVNQSAKRYQITLTRFEPDGDQGVRVWLDKAVFDDVMSWTHKLESEGIRIAQFNAERAAPGRANFRITFQR